MNKRNKNRSGASGPWQVLILMPAVLAALTVFAQDTWAQQTINVRPLNFTPSMNGSFSGWEDVGGVKVPMKGLKGGAKISSVTVKAGMRGDDVYIYLQWADSTEDKVHKPYVWNTGKGRYEKSKKLEDRIALQFAMEGDYSTNWASGKSFKADMWHWKAFRSNEIGLVHDKMTIISTQSTKKSYKLKTNSGKTVYISRPSDKGDRLYKSVRYRKKDKDVMPSYSLTRNPSGSIADIRAKGVWKGGMWTVVMKRKLSTGNPDDVKFSSGKSVKGGIAVFDQSGNDRHDISETLVFQF